MVESERSRYGSTLLVVFLILLVLGGLFLGLARVMHCPGCGGRPVAMLFKDGTEKEMARIETIGPYVVGKDREGKVVRIPIADVDRFLPCARCQRTGMVSILRWLSWKREPGAQ